MQQKDVRVVIYGAGGHGKVVADVATQSGNIVTGFVDDDITTGCAARLPLPLLGNRSYLCQGLPASDRVALGIGDNSQRMAAAQFLARNHVALATMISPFAVVSSSARVGVGTVIMPGAVVNAMAQIGDGVIVNTGAIVEHDVTVGNFVHLSPHSTLGGGAQIGELAHVAIGSTVLPGVRIGARSILGAGAVATRDVPDDVIALGIPARITRRLPIREGSTARSMIESVG